jgi:type VI secretion system protein ImpL
MRVDNLRLLVRFTLGAELPGRLARSTGFVRRGLRPVEAAQAAVSSARLQHAARCSLAKAMSALDARLFERNDLLASETDLAQRIARLLGPSARPAPYGETVEALREIIAALDRQEALLAQGDYAWLHRATPSLGPAHEKLLARAEAIALLLGPDAVDQVRAQSGKALQRFRSQFAATFRNGGQPSLVWAAGSGRLVLSPERAALREGLTGLLREPFMVPPSEAGLPAGDVSAYSWDIERLDQALVLGQERGRFLAEGLPRFPPAVRRGIARIVDAQVAQLVQDRLIAAMTPAEPRAVLDAARRERLAKVGGLLAELGARQSAEWLRAGEVKVPGSPSGPRA